MFMRIVLVYVLLLTALPLPAVAGDGSFLGTGLGAIAGGLIGNSLGRGGGQGVATGVGVITGAVIGNQIGQDIDNQNRGGYAAPSPYSYYDTPSAFGVTTVYAPNYVAPPAPPPIYIDTTARTYCRPFSQQVIIDGQTQETYGTACLQPDGTWRTVP